VYYVVCYVLRLIVTFREIEKMIKDNGWFEVNTEGSHHHYKHLAKPGKVTIPFCHGDIPKRVINSILKQAGLK
jgi:predicted RNA binding protein YcfA (HicA-like mRNA interferase family)